MNNSVSKSNDEKFEYFNGVKYQYSPGWIKELETERHWRMYWHQQKMMQQKVLPEQTVLEIGVGSGFTANYLRSRGVHVATFDIDAEKNPDIIGNLATYEFRESYDHVLAFEVFEHIPFEEFSRTLKKLAPICKGYVFFSVPRSEKTVIQGEIKMPFAEFTYHVRRPRKQISSKHHFWEVNHPATSWNAVQQTIQTAGFEIVETEQFYAVQFLTLKPST